MSIIVAIHVFAFLICPLGAYAYDSGQYLRMMEVGTFTDFHPPGYSLVLALSRLVSDSPFTPYVLNHGASCITTLLIYHCAFRGFGKDLFSSVVALPWAIATWFCTRTHPMGLLAAQRFSFHHSAPVADHFGGPCWKSRYVQRAEGGRTGRVIWSSTPDSICSGVPRPRAARGHKTCIRRSQYEGLPEECGGLLGCCVVRLCPVLCPLLANARRPSPPPRFLHRLVHGIC